MNYSQSIDSKLMNSSIPNYFYNSFKFSHLHFLTGFVDESAALLVKKKNRDSSVSVAGRNFAVAKAIFFSIEFN